MTFVVRGMAMENNDAEGRTWSTDAGNHNLKQMVRESLVVWGEGGCGV